MNEFEGKVALITGAGNGIGKAAALLFAARGAKVAVADVATGDGQAAVAEIEALGARAIFVHCDVSDRLSVRDMVDETVRLLGGLDCAFNNAGINHPQDPEWDDEAFQRTLDINVTGVMQCMKQELRHMIPLRRGSIVNTSSVGGMIATVIPSMPAYTASKHAVIGLTRSFALSQAANGIRVNAIMPGVTLTNMVREVAAQGPEVRKALDQMAPMGRMARPEEIAEAAVWLCSDRSSFVTAHALAVDGGFLAQ